MRARRTSRAEGRDSKRLSSRLRVTLLKARGPWLLLTLHVEGKEFDTSVDRTKILHVEGKEFDTSVDRIKILYVEGKSSFDTSVDRTKILHVEGKSSFDTSLDRIKILHVEGGVRHVLGKN